MTALPLARPHIPPSCGHHLRSSHGDVGLVLALEGPASWGMEQGGVCLLPLGLLRPSVCILRPSGPCLLSPAHMHTAVRRPGGPHAGCPGPDNSHLHAAGSPCLCTETCVEMHGVSALQRPSGGQSCVHVADFWDTAGQERFQSMHASYYHKAHACIMVRAQLGGRQRLRESLA